uniref:Uncharacterized protein n=1 Tax=Arundo donax TaxID=35708 RepID=A0A0A8YQ46_ARUDO
MLDRHCLCHFLVEFWSDRSLLNRLGRFTWYFRTVLRILLTC